MTPTAFAFSDFDDTLARGDSVLPYLLHSIRRGYAPWWQIFRAAYGFLRWKVKPSTGRAAKELSLSYIAGRSVAEMDELAREFFRGYMKTHVYTEAVQEMAALRAHGVKVVVVSASSDVYMRVLPEFMPVDAMLCTVCTAENGVYTGKVQKNCKGEEKVRRIQAWLAAEGLDIDRAASCGYGDSASDAYMMELTASPTLVNPKRALRKRLPGARQVHWR